MTSAAPGGELARLCGMVKFRFGLAAVVSTFTLSSRADKEFMVSSTFDMLLGTGSGLATWDRGGVIGGVDERAGVSCRVETLDETRLANESSRFGMLNGMLSICC